MKRIIILLGICFIYLSAQDLLEIVVKGISDAKNDGAQKDRLEAILDAKRQACEKAGLEINAKTTVENFQTVYDYVETQANAILLPGFQIVDVGYMADGTYQVVLSGKVKVIVAEEISIKELRYAKSLNDRGQYSQCEAILKKYINSEDKEVSEQLKEEALYYLIKWGYSFNIQEDVQKYIAYYPEGKNIQKLENFAGFAQKPVYGYKKAIEPDSTKWQDHEFDYENVHYTKIIHVLNDTINFSDFNSNNHNLIISYSLYQTGKDEDSKGRSAYELKIYYGKGDIRKLNISDLKVIEERFRSFTHTGSPTFSHSSSGKWFDHFKLKNYQISGRVPAGTGKYPQIIEFDIYQKAF
jgi:hypothetical protein